MLHLQKYNDMFRKYGLKTSHNSKEKPRSLQLVFAIIQTNDNIIKSYYVYTDTSGVQKFVV